MTERCVFAKWKCPVCEAKGRRWLSPYRARRNFVAHCKKIHKNRDIKPIIIKKKLRREEDDTGGNRKSIRATEDD